MTPGAAARRLHGATVLLRHQVQVLLVETAQNALADAKRMSSGNVTQRMLSTPVSRGGYGAPYGHGPIGWLGPRGPVPHNGNLAIINRQTGDFWRRWNMYARPWEAVVFNDSPIGQYLVNGTRFTQPRPIDQAVLANAKQSISRDVQQLVKDLFT